MSEWQSIETAPKDGTDILICMPGGQSDHYYPVYWSDDDEVEEPCWLCPWCPEMVLTEKDISGCYLLPMWKHLDPPPSSLCATPGSIKNPNYVP